MTIYYQDERVTLYHGDCLDVLRALPDESVHAVVTDPPAGISFMGKDWDGHKGGREQWSAWLADVMREAYRVTKPGGHALVWALPRTSHWTACGLEDAGWEIRDKIVHLFGTGFPKSLDVSKAIDKAAGAEREVVGQSATVTPRSGKTGAGFAPGGVIRWGDEHYKWEDAPAEAIAYYTERAATRGQITAPTTPDAERWQGWGTALKPAAEDWWLARKPMGQTVAANVLQHGTGALNIDACRVGTGESLSRPSGNTGFLADGVGSIEELRALAAEGGKCPNGRDARATLARWEANHGTTRDEPAGRWPTNVVLDDSQAAELDEMSGIQRDGVAVKRNGRTEATEGWGNIGKAAVGTPDVTYGSSGGASRFFPTFRYEAKAPTSERPRYTRPKLRLRDDLTPAQVDHVRARLAEAGVQVD